MAQPTSNTAPYLDKLSLELRTIIYSYVFASSTPIELGTAATSIRTALLRTSKAIRREATPVFYDNGSFALALTLERAAHVQDLMNAIGPENCKRMDQLVLSVECSPALTRDGIELALKLSSDAGSVYLSRRRELVVEYRTLCTQVVDALMIAGMNARSLEIKALEEERMSKQGKADQMTAVMSCVFVRERRAMVKTAKARGSNSGADDNRDE